MIRPDHARPPCAPSIFEGSDHAACVERLRGAIASGCDPDHDARGAAPVHHVLAWWRCADDLIAAGVGILAGAGADMAVLDHVGRDPLHVACIAREGVVLTATVDACLAAGCRPTADHVRVAAANGGVPVVRRLLDVVDRDGSVLDAMLDGIATAADAHAGRVAVGEDARPWGMADPPVAAAMVADAVGRGCAAPRMPALRASAGMSGAGRFAEALDGHGPRCACIAAVVRRLAGVDRPASVDADAADWLLRSAATDDIPLAVLALLSERPS